MSSNEKLKNELKNSISFQDEFDKCKLENAKFSKEILDLKNSILGKKVLWGSDKRNRGSTLVKRRIWGFEKPCFFKKLMTRSGFCGVSKVTYLVAELASLGEKPQVSMRYETVKE